MALLSLSRQLGLLAVLSCFVSVANSEDARTQASEFAAYRHDSLRTADAAVLSWSTESKKTAGDFVKRSLTRSVGRPRAFRVAVGDKIRTVVRFDGQSALWQTSNEWGSLAEKRTVLAVLRLHQNAEGFLFDGSTNSGLTRVQVRDGKWQVGVQAPPIGNAANPDIATHHAKYGEWQAHAFVFEKSGTQTTIRHLVAASDLVETSNATSDVAHPLSGFILGTNAATKMGLRCDVADVTVFEGLIADTDLDQRLKSLRAEWQNAQDLPAEKQPTEPGIYDPQVFSKVLRKGGDDGSKAYRIPGLATTPKGTLLAVFDIRYNGGGDLPANIDVGLMRSLDSGETWSSMQKILDFDQNEAGSRGNGVGDPAILVDREKGSVFVAALWSKGNRAWHGSGPGLAPDETGQFVLTKSTDDGVTWSPPINITKQIKRPEWRLCFQGPGAGIQTRNGKLIFPAQFKDAANVPHSCFIVSCDHGETWTISPAALPDRPPTSEAQIAELDDGSLLLSMRDESRSGKRAWARWEWNEKEPNSIVGKWTRTWSTLPDPTCMASLLRTPSGALLFSNPQSSTQRIALTIRKSHDGGQTWNAGRLIDPRGCMYSCLTILADGRVAVLYEVEGTLTFARLARNADR
mgnify:CR=1 FL=1